MNGRFAISMHILTLLTKANGDWVTSDFIAGSININPVLVRKEISNLRKKGLVVSREGKNGGTMLAKPASQIRVSDVFLATNQGTVLGNARNSPNPDCPVGRQINRHLDSLYQEAEEALVRNLGTSTLDDFVHRFD
ncbi:MULTISPECIES: Rrf2 family transcriptional regulator [unclassified Spirosoma]|uniref:Rrf2 family transcriptional regulator n=1 Tax=unclassified Spirosoma TaxID=2621999 RepID=UPI00095AE4E3|nr:MULTISPECIES: Rrf2 family transcriptional regulator [unclassified Spirosoma]MBN8826492.1 Rrf2 family transcriptional regulator [Spirosoma sp.]OJW76417.1 MAG: transcriptional regulator [Spirosoma sp. 48-14]